MSSLLSLHRPWFSECRYFFSLSKTRSLLHLRTAKSPREPPAALTTSLLTVPHRNINTLKLYRSKPVTLLFLSMLILALSTMWTSLMSAPLMSPTRMAPIRSPSLTVRPLTLPRSYNLQFKIPADLHVCRDFSLQRAELCRKHAEHDFRVHLRAKALDGGFGQPQGTLGGNALHRCVGLCRRPAAATARKSVSRAAAPALSFS